MSDDARMEVGIVGGGRVATALAAALARPDARCDVLAWARRPGALAGAGVEVAPDLARVALRRTILVAVSDDAIDAVAAELAELLPADAERTCLHTSGSSTGAAAMPSLGTRPGVVRGSLHPLVAVPDRAGPDVLRGGDHVVEAERPEGVERAAEIVRRVGGRLLRLPDGDPATKARYHALATMVATGVVALVDRAAHELGEDAAARAAFRAAFARLAATGASNVETDAGARVLTGPVARGDATTLARHDGVLRGTPAEDLYRAVRRAAEEMLESGEDPPA